jgi:hypothetical protein
VLTLQIQLFSFHIVIKTYLSRVNQFSNTIQACTSDCPPTVVKSAPPQIAVSKRFFSPFSTSARSRKVPGVVFFAGLVPAPDLSGRHFPAGSLPGEMHGDFLTGL